MVMTVEFELDGPRFVGINGGDQFKFDEAVSFEIVSTDVSTSVPIQAGAKLGTVTVRDQDGTEHSIPVFATADVGPAKFALAGDPVGPVTAVLIVSLIGGAWLVRRRAMRV